MPEQTLNNTKPFLKWAGGKRQLLPTLEKYIPASYTTYYAPFVGAGALLFHLQPIKAVINDINSELINCYRVIRDYPDKLIALCEEHKQNNSENYYYQIREQDRLSNYCDRSSLEKAARILYLNKICYNGVFRVNKNNEYNTPWGRYSNPTIVNPDVIKAVSDYLNQNLITIFNGDFSESVATVDAGSWIYFDPPYHPINPDSFVGYSSDNFTEADQRRLKELCDQLTNKGCQILLSNSTAPLIRSLYDDSKYKIIEVEANRAVNSKGSKRGKIKELLIYNNYALI